MALRFSDLFLVRQQRAPRENLDRLPGCRLRKFIPRQGQKPNDIQPLFFDNLHAVKWRRIVEAPNEAVRRRELQADRLILRSQITAKHRRLAEVVARRTTRESTESRPFDMSSQLSSSKSADCPGVAEQRRGERVDQIDKRRRAVLSNIESTSMRRWRRRNTDVSGPPSAYSRTSRSSTALTQCSQPRR